MLTVGSVHNGMLQSGEVVLGVLQENENSSPVKSNNSSNGVANGAFDEILENTPASELVGEDV